MSEHFRHWRWQWHQRPSQPLDGAPSLAIVLAETKRCRTLSMLAPLSTLARQNRDTHLHKFTMPLPIIEEGIVLDTFSTTNNGSRPLGHNAIYGTSSDDTPSIFSYSTNSTASNLPGPGRVLGNLYSSTGRRLERTLGELAHKAGFSPEAIYQQISTLYLEDWKTDDKKVSMLQKLCFKLFKQTKSIADSTRFRAIMRWRDILRDQHEIYGWLFCTQQERMVKHASTLLRVIEELQSTTNTLSDDQDAVLCETSLLVNLHSVGLNVITVNHARLLIEGGNFQVDRTGATEIHREEIKKWDLCFQYLLKSLSDPTISELSQWYIDFWSSQIVQGNVHASFVLQSCLTLRSVLEALDPSNIDLWDTLAVLGKKMHEHFVGRYHSRVLLLAQWDDFLPCDGVPVHISTILNDLAQSYNRLFSPGLDTVPDLTCITMLGSTETISADVKDKIKGFPKDLQNVDKGEDTAFTEMLLLQSCYRLLRRALSELDDTDCIKKLSNVTSFADGTSRCAILQLGDILESLPELYMLLITLGGDEMRDSVLTLCESLDISGNSRKRLKRYPGILMDLRSLLQCHLIGLSLMSEHVLYRWPYKVDEFISRTAPYNNLIANFRGAREFFMLYLMDNVTFNPLIFYLKYCASRIRHALFHRFYKHSLLLCSIVQGALLKERSVLRENRSAMKELCRAMQISIIEQLRSRIELGDTHMTKLGDALWCVYTDLTEARHVGAFKNEAEAYLLQLCELLFDIIRKTKAMTYKDEAISGLSDFFRPRNVLGWFLSNRGLDAQESILRLLEGTRYPRAEHYNWPFSHLETHRLGVELLAPRHEKLHFKGAGLTKHLSTRTVEPPLTPDQKKRWINAFKSLAANLSSTDQDLMDISLFYFANCPLSYEEDPMLDTALALDYCERLQLFLESRNIDESTIKENLYRAVSHIHTCLTKRVECVQQSCMDLAFYQAPYFDGAPFEVSKVVKVLNGLAKSCKENLGADTPELLSPPDY